MVNDKIDMCVKELEELGRVVDYKVKYLDKYGFASCYFKLRNNDSLSIIPVLIIPNSEEDLSDYIKFLTFLNNSWITSFFNYKGVLDEQSIVSILKFTEYERFKTSGKSSLDEDLSDCNYIKSVRGVISSYVMPFSKGGNPKCIFDECSHKLHVVSDEVTEYFDEAREYLGI